jgi:hypothetical protein
MIRINLHHRKAAVGVTSGSATGATSAGLQGLLDRIKGGGEGFADGDKRAAVILTVVYAAFLGAGYWYSGQRKTEMLEAVSSESASLDSKLNLLTSELNKTNGYEQTKKSLEEDEKTIRTKIETIQELIRDRTTPPKILTTLSESIPKEVWLQEFSLKDQHFKISGSASSMDVVSDFMKSLEETIYFKNVVLKSSKQDTVKGGRSAATFELEADRR